MNHFQVKLTEIDKMDIYKGLVIAMKCLDEYENGADTILSDRLEILLSKIENASLSEPNNVIHTHN